MAAIERWYFDLEHIHSTPSIKCGYDHDKELSCRQQAANFIQDMGQRLQVYPFIVFLFYERPNVLLMLCNMGYVCCYFALPCFVPTVSL